MQLPEFIVAYATALLSAPWRFTLVYLSAFSNTSHDALTRGLQKKYSFKHLLRMLLSEKLLRTGYIILDETDVDKSFAKQMQGLSWIYSHRKNKYIFGLHIVVMVWTNGTGFKTMKMVGKTKLGISYFHLRDQVSNRHHAKSKVEKGSKGKH